MFGIIDDPDEFYATADAGRLRFAAVVVLAAGLANSFGGFAILFKSWSTLTAASPIVQAVTAFSVGSVLIGMFVLWALYTSVMYVMARLLDGAGTFRTLFSYVAYGFVPNIVGGLLNTVVVLWKIAGTRFPDSPQQLGVFVQQLTSGPLFTALSVGGIALAVWSGFIWIFAVKHAQDVDLRTAIASVFPVVAFSIFWQLNDLVGFF